VWVSTPDSDDPWYAVRCLLFFESEPSDEATATYEERITLWRAHSFDDAIERAEADAKAYADLLDGKYIGLAQAFYLSEEGEVGDGAEIFSLMRRSSLPNSEYLSLYFDTGDEHQRRSH
jgi:hypothetical protein